MKRSTLTFWLLIALAVLAGLSSAQQAWALPGQDRLHQTVPTRTPFRSPTAKPPATSIPSETPAPTALIASVTPVATIPAPLTATALPTAISVPPATSQPATNTAVPGATAIPPAASSTLPAPTATAATTGTATPAPDLTQTPRSVSRTPALPATAEFTPSLAAPAAAGSVQVTLRAERFAVWEGQPITVSLQVSNTGTTAVQNLTVRLVWPSELAPISISGACLLPNPGTSEIRFDTLAPAAQSTCMLQTHVLADVTHGKVLLLGGEARWQGGQTRVEGDRVGLPPAELPVMGGKG